jgi:hypothetical protein
LNDCLGYKKHAFKSVFEKKCDNIWWIEKKVVPLHAFSGDLVPDL